MEKIIIGNHSVDYCEIPLRKCTLRFECENCQEKFFILKNS